MALELNLWVDPSNNTNVLDSSVLGGTDNCTYGFVGNDYLISKNFNTILREMSLVTKSLAEALFDPSVSIRTSGSKIQNLNSKTTVADLKSAIISVLNGLKVSTLYGGAKNDIPYQTTTGTGFITAPTLPGQVLTAIGTTPTDLSVKWSSIPETVTANPSDTATATLSKIKINNTVYSVPSGSSGAVTSVNGQTGDVNVQATLVSGTNIKTINGNSILGNGDLAIHGDVTSVNGATGAVTIPVVKANTGTATATLTKLKIDNTVYSVPQGGSSAVTSVNGLTGDVTVPVVVMNPVETATATATKIKVDNTVYDIPQAGSSVTGIKLNSATAQTGSVGPFYAPTTAGSTGNVLASNGAGAPIWTPTVTNAANVTSSIGGHTLSEIFGSDGTTVKEALHATAASNAGTATYAADVLLSIAGHSISTIFESDGTTAKKATKALGLQSFAMSYAGGVLTITYVEEQ